MKNQLKAFVLLAAAFVIFLCPQILRAQDPDSFSADMVMNAQGKTFEAKMYVSRDKSRMEMPESIVITRLDQNVSWMVMPSQQAYMENPIDPKMRRQVSRNVPDEISREKVGTDVIDGKTADKFKVDYTDNGAPASLFQWIAGDSPIPLKIEAADGSWSVEYRNIKTGEPDASLFEVPAGYQKMAMPNMGQMMQKMAGQMGNVSGDSQE